MNGISSSWNRAVVQREGRAPGSETKHAGIDVILGPAICIGRNPLRGRVFEYMSEDPDLTGQLAAGDIFSTLGFYPVNPANGVYCFRNK